MEVISKICTGCGFILPAHPDYFNRNKNNQDGFQLLCKICRKKNREDNKEIISCRDKKYREDNKERIAYRNKKYYKYNKEVISDKCKKYREENKDTLNSYQRKYYKENIEKYIKYRNSPAIYETYHNKLKKYEETRNNNGSLEVRCAYCGKWFKCTNTQVKNRLACINTINKGEKRFYCQNFCKEACPVYYQMKTPKQNQYTKSNEVNPQLRQKVFELDNYECQMCGSKDELHCHHILPAALNPMTANDPDVCITLCKKCHANVHSKEGCRYHELKCKT